MNARRLAGDKEALTYCAVGETCGHELQHIGLATRQSQTVEWRSELFLRVDEPNVQSGASRQQIDPAEISPGELVHQIRQAVLKGGVRMVVIDSLNGYLNAMPEERYLNLQLHELLAFLGQQGVITIMVLAQQGLVGAMQAIVDLTYLADTVVLFRYYESLGAVHQALSIIKKRSGNHERTIREIKVSKGGIEVGDPLTHLHGVLTGVPSAGPKLDHFLRLPDGGA